MRKTLLTSATLMGLGLVAPAFAQPLPDAGTATDVGPGAAGTQTGGQQYGQQPYYPPQQRYYPPAGQAGDTSGWPYAHPPGTGMSGPPSTRSSNINGTDSRSQVAPHLPQPVMGENGSPEGYLNDAQQALSMHRTGEAQQALEMAETRLLDRSTPVQEANLPDQRPEVQLVTQARQALGQGDIAGAQEAIRMALARAPRPGGGPMGMGTSNGYGVPPAPGMAPGGPMGATGPVVGGPPAYGQ